MQTRIFSRATWLGFLGMWLLIALPSVQADSESLTFIEGVGTAI